MTGHVHTKEQGLAAMEALGYTRDDMVVSMLISVGEISVRRVVKVDAGWAVVEDRTLLRPDVGQEHSVPAGPLDTSPEAGQPG